MNKKSIYVYIAATLAMIIPAPGRFACGLILVLELNMLMLIGTLLRDLIRRLRLERTGELLLISMLISLTLLMRQIVVLIMPETAMQLGFVMYLPAVSSYFIGYMFGEEQNELGDALSRNMKHSALYSLFALTFFIIRDIAGFGTITYITADGIRQKVLFDSESITVMTFFATIPGALVCTAVVLIIHVFLFNKFRIVENAEEDDD
jgi:hypothetical protein